MRNSNLHNILKQKNQKTSNAFFTNNADEKFIYNCEFLDLNFRFRFNGEGWIVEYLHRFNYPLILFPFILPFKKWKPVSTYNGSETPFPYKNTSDAFNELIQEIHSNLSNIYLNEQRNTSNANSLV
jgi:hypothetical protein